MTQPDGLTPSGSPSPFSAFAAKTQTDYENERKSAETSRWGGGILDWFINLLPQQILAPVQALVEILIDALDLIPIFGPLAGNVVEYLANVFGLLNDKSAAAQDTANTAQDTANSAQGTANTGAADAAVTLATSESTGALIVDNFNGAADSSANGLGSNWTQTYESGAGTLGLDGDGNARWYQSGNGSRYAKARYSATALSTDTQKAQFVVNTTMPDYFVDPELWLCLRVDSGFNNFVAGRIYAGAIEIGYVLSGSYTRLGSPLPVTSGPGVTWAFCAGTSGGAYQFKLIRDGVPLLTQTDSTPSSLKGSSYRYSGMRVRAGAQSIGWVTQQKAHPPLGVFTAIDYTP